MSEVAAKRPSLFTGLEKAVFIAGLVGVVADLATPVAPVALYALAGAVLVFGLVVVWSLFSRQPSQTRLTLVSLSFLIGAAAGLVLFFQTEDEDTAARGVLASNVGPIAQIQSDLFDLSETVEQIAETTDRIDETTTRIDERTVEIDRTTRETQAALENVKRETSDDPRKEIVNIGREWNQQGFQIAVNERDLRAVDLYLQGGMQMNGTTMKFYILPYYISDDAYDPAMADLLLQYEAVGTDGLCIPNYSDWDFFQLDRRLPHLDDRRQTIRELCATPGVRTEIDALLKAERDKVAEAEAANANVDQLRVDCARDFAAANPVDATINAASQFSILRASTLRAPRDNVLAELNAWLLMGAPGDPNAAYASAVAKGCAAAHRVRDVSDEGVREIQAARDIIFP